MGTTRHLLGAWAAVSLFGCYIGIFDSDGVDSHRNLNVEVTESFYVELDAAQTVRLSLEGINGAVTILGEAGSGVAKVSAQRRVRSDTRADARDFLARVVVDVWEVGDEIQVRTSQPRNTVGREVIVDYDLIIPVHLAVSVVNINGAVDVRAIDGTVDIDNINGAVSVLEAIGNVEVTLVNGNVTCDVALESGGHVDLSVVNGNVALDVPTSVSAMLEADVVNGTISVSALTLQDAVSSPGSVHGRLGAGDGLIDLDTTNGTITVRGR
jgi:hypothetical protein